MSFESANFLYFPESTPSGGWGRFLVRNGAEARRTGSEFAQYTQKGKNYWIDFQILPANGDMLDQISIRSALCNPDPVIDHLLRSLRTLLAEGGGKVVDRHSGQEVRIWSPAAEAVLVQSFRDQQRRFSRFFGTSKAAIPAETVFEHFRKEIGSKEEEL